MFAVLYMAAADFAIGSPSCCPAGDRKMSEPSRLLWSSQAVKFAVAAISVKPAGHADGVAAAAVAAVAQSSSSSRRGSSIINSVRVFPRERSPEREEQELRAPTRSRPLASLSPESCCVRTSSRSIARARPRAAARAHFYCLQYRARAIRISS